MAGAERARRRIMERAEAAAGEAPDPESLYAGLVGALADVMPVASACWHLNDPVTGVLTRTGALGEPPGTYEQAIELEFTRDDVAAIAEVIRRPRPVGHPERGDRRRAPAEPSLPRDAGARRSGRRAARRLRRPLRAVGLHRPVRLAPLRPRRRRAGCAALPGRVPGPAGRRGPCEVAAGGEAEGLPAVVVLDGRDGLEAADDRARDRLAELGAGSGAAGLPGMVHVLAAQARRGDPAQQARARVQTREGRWYLLDASTLGAGPRARVAVVIQPAPAGSLTDTLLLAHGLTAREREIAALVVAGRSTAAIAAALHLSPWTVQDHLKAVFEKVGVNSRRALVARVSADAGRPAATPPRPGPEPPPRVGAAR